MEKQVVEIMSDFLWGVGWFLVGLATFQIRGIKHTFTAISAAFSIPQIASSISLTSPSELAGKNGEPFHAVIMCHKVPPEITPSAISLSPSRASLRKSSKSFRGFTISKLLSNGSSRVPTSTSNSFLFRSRFSRYFL